MTNPVTPQDYATFLESLRVTEEVATEMHGWRMDANLEEFIKIAIEDVDRDIEHRFLYMFERLRRAEANRKPSTLFEDVKSCVRAVMVIGRQCERETCPCDGTVCFEEKFRKLSE